MSGDRNNRGINNRGRLSTGCPRDREPLTERPAHCGRKIVAHKQSGFWIDAWHARQLFSAVPIFAIGTGALYPLIALELSYSGHDKSAIGAITSAWYLGAFLGTLVGGRIIYRFGHHRTFVFAAILAAFSVWGFYLSDSLILWLVLRFVGGLGIGTYYLLMESWISGLAASATRGRMLATYEALRLGAVALGPLLLIVASSHTAFALIGFAFVLTIFPVAAARRPTTEFKSAGWRQALEIFVCSPCSLALTLTAGLLSSSFYAFGAIYAEALGFSKADSALFVSIIFLAPAASQLPIGTLADLCGRARTALAISLLAMACALMLALEMPSSFLAVAIAAAALTGLSHPLYALGHGRLVDGGHDLLGATTAGLIAYNIGTIAGPFGAALAMDYQDGAGLYFWAGLCLILGVVAAMLAMMESQARCCPL